MTTKIVECPKCFGTGQYAHFGECWKCNGGGNVETKVYTDEENEKARLQRIEKYQTKCKEVKALNEKQHPFLKNIEWADVKAGLPKMLFNNYTDGQYVLSKKQAELIKNNLK